MTTPSETLNKKAFNLKTVAQSLLIAGAIGAVAMPAVARDYRDHRYAQNSSIDYAKVVDVSPIVETYQVNEPVEQCWDERVDRRHHGDRRHSSRTGEIFGAIIGAAVGNQFGSGRGKKVATAAGAILGASVANDVKNQNRHSRRHDSRGGYDIVKRCDITDNYVTEEQVVGYNVAYKYRGNVYHTEMDQHPGDKIRVKVSVDPL